MTTDPRLASIEIAGGVRVVCPDDWRLITTYVLIEQQDWFEDEIRFLREALEADSVLIDIGANYGVYSLAAAGRSPNGRVWAYEPCTATAGCLRRSIVDNGFVNVTLSAQALSDRPGSGVLKFGASPELNALVEDSGASGPAEAVELTTLDEQRALHRWRRVDVIKIDAEGHEARVINGGRAFFSELSPLVMCEIKAGASVDLTAVDLLAESGYRPYRLVPGLQALAPQDLAAPVDAYQLNIFLCKPDRAAALRRSNRLIDAESVADPAPTATADAWVSLFRGMTFGQAIIDRWADNVARLPQEAWKEYREVLNLYALSRDGSLGITARYEALGAALAKLRGGIEQRQSLPRLMSYARIAADYGARVDAVNALTYLVNNTGRFQAQDFTSEPFLSPSADFDAIAPTGSLQAWAWSSIIDAFERHRSFSGYFSDPNVTLRMTGELRRLGYMTPEMRRREALAQRRWSALKGAGPDPANSGA